MAPRPPSRAAAPRERPTGFAPAASFSGPRGLALSGDGATLFVADTGSHLIRAVAVASGAVSTLAGCGVAGFLSGFGATAGGEPPLGAAGGRQRSGNNCVRALALDGTAAVTRVTSVCGAGAGNTVGAATGTYFSGPRGIAAWGGSVFVADTGNHQLKVVSGCAAASPTPTPSPSATVGFSPTASSSPPPSPPPPGCMVAALAGTPGVAGSADGVGAAAQFQNPRGLALMPNGTALVADHTNHRIRVATPGGLVTTLAGTGVAGNADGGPGVGSLSNPMSIAIDPVGAIAFVACPGSHTIRALNLGSGFIRSFAGSGAPGFVNGVSTAAQFPAPRASP